MFRLRAICLRRNLQICQFSSSNFVNPGKSIASTQGGATTASKARRFDEHTISIWAENMVQRGGSPIQAIKMILNRIELGRARPTTEIFNTAIDICGHYGFAKEAASILHTMISRNAHPNERTVTSLLNSLAERARALPQATNSEEKVDLNIKSSFDNSIASFPGLESFEFKCKRDTAELAIRIYASWVGYTGNLNCHPFNALLKCIWRSESADLLSYVFPLDKPVKWVPKKLDEVTFSTAIMAAESDAKDPFKLGLAYLDAASQFHNDPGIISSVILLLYHKLVKTSIPWTPENTNFFTEFIEKHLKNQKIHLTVATTNKLMVMIDKLELYELGLEVWSKNLLPILRKNDSFVKSSAQVNEITIIYMFHFLLKLGRPNDMIKLLDDVKSDFGMHINTKMLNLLIEACRLTKKRPKAEAIFVKWIRRKKSIVPDFETLKKFLLCIKEDIFPKAFILEKAKKYLEWFSDKYPEIVDQLIHDKEVSPFIIEVLNEKSPNMWTYERYVAGKRVNDNNTSKDQNPQ